MSGAAHHLTRGLLRLAVLTLPAFLLLSVLDRRSDPSLSWVDTHGSVGEGDPVPADVFGTPRPGTRLDLTSQPTYSVAHPSLGLWLLTLLAPVLVATAITAVAVLLLRTLHETEAGTPFGPVAARRLRLVALLVGVVGVTGPLASAVAGWAVVRRVTGEHAGAPLGQWNPLSPLPWLLVALLVLVVAEAFGIGSRLTEDVEGLV